MTDADLPPFGSATTCTKCDSDELATQYQQGVPFIRCGGGDVTLITNGMDGRECQLRTCRTCGWAWLEACADASKPVDHVDLPDGGRLEFSRPLPQSVAYRFRDDFLGDGSGGMVTITRVEAGSSTDTVMRGHDASGP